MPGPNYEPQPVGESLEYWVDYERLDKNGQPTLVYEKPPDTVPGGVFGSGNRPYKSKHVTRITFDNGEIFDFDDENRSTYVKTDPQLRAAYQNANKTLSPYRFSQEGSVYEYQPQESGTEGPPYVKQIYQASPKPGEGTFIRGNVQYRYDANGKPVPNYTFPSSGEGGLTEYQRMQAEGTPWERAVQATKELQWKQEMEQQKLKDAWARANQTTQTQVQAMGDAQIPGQQYFMGAEPGGPMEQIAKFQGWTYNPENFRAPIIQIDPEAEWRKAMAQMNGQR